MALPQTLLAQLSLGACTPEDLLARLPVRLDPEDVAALSTRLPARQPHLFPADRP